MNLLDRAITKMKRGVLKPYLCQQMHGKGMAFVEPNYIFFPSFQTGDTVIDVGCGHEAELALYLIREFGVQAIGVDPTRKHRSCLDGYAKEFEGRFRVLPVAVTEQSGMLTFFESYENESGSVLKKHANVLNDTVESYSVEALSLRDLCSRVEVSEVAFIKLDLEGAEYTLIQSLQKEDVSAFKQMFIEFHHHCTEYSVRDTLKAVSRVESLGLKSFTLDFRNYLFYRV